MRLLFNYTNRNTDRNTDRSSQLVNIYSEVINKNRMENKTYFVLKIFYKRIFYKPGMNPAAGIRVKITITQGIYKNTHTHKNSIVQNNFFKWLLLHLHFL